MRIVIAAIISVLAAACAAPAAPDGSGAATPSVAAPSAVAVPTSAALPSVEPTLTTAPATTEPATPPPSAGTAVTGPYVPGQAVRVTVDNLRLREDPTTASKIVGTLHPDDVLVLNQWPTSAEGYTWYPAYLVSTTGSLPPLPTHPIYDRESLLVGWAAVEKGAESYVAPMPKRCPTTVDLANVSGMLPFELLACFGRRTIELEGIFGCGGCGGTTVGTFEPNWLAEPFGYSFLSVEPHDRFGPLSLYLPPDGQAAPDAASIIRVRGHFDDPRALDCRISVAYGTGDVLVPLASSLATGSCRQRFVVEHYDVLGTDPDFPFG